MVLDPIWGTQAKRAILHICDLQKFEKILCLFLNCLSKLGCSYVYMFFNSISVNLACLQSMSYLCSNMLFGLGDYHRKYDWMTFNYLHDMMILNNMLMSYEKHEIHLHAQMKKHELMIAFFNCNNVWKAYETQMKKDLASIQGFTIQMSLFLYLLNMSTIIRISYPEKSSRVQSCSWHV